MRGAQDDDDARAFRYFAAVCGAVAADRPVPAADATVDPGAILALAQRHRIAPRSADALAAALGADDPAAPIVALAAHARVRRIAALYRAGRLAAISTALTTAGVRHLAIKGPALAQQLYGDVAARDSKDIDLLIDPAGLARAAAVFGALGFADTAAGDAGGGSPGKHRTYAGHGIEIEAHARLFDIDALLPLSFAAIWPRRDMVMLGGVAVPVLSSADTLLYLCAHGAEHVWFRLKWLEDIARIVALAGKGMHPSVVAEALRLARETGAEAIFVSALQLARDVLGITCVDAAPATRTSRALVRLSKEALAAPAELASAPPIGWILRKLPVQWGMARHWRYRRGLIRHLVLAERGFDARLPRVLGWLRLPLRPAMLLRDRWRR